MDIHRALSLREVADKQIENAEKYAKARELSGKAESALKIMIASNLKELLSQKKNLGIEMATLMLIENNSAARGFYQEWIEQEAKYKGLEKLLDACASKLITEQAIMKFTKEGEKWG